MAPTWAGPDLFIFSAQAEILITTQTELLKLV